LRAATAVSSRTEETPDLTTRIENATKRLVPSYQKRLGKLSPKHISVICDYISAIGSEIKISDTYRQSILNTLITLSVSNSKRFKDFTRADIIRYLDHFRKHSGSVAQMGWYLQCKTSQHHQVLQMVV
jgi:hypothetical protein